MRQYQTHAVYLEMARVIFETSNRLILNPRNTETTSLANADSTFVADLSRYMQEMGYQVDKLKRERGLT